MKSGLAIFPALVLTTLFLSFSSKEDIAECYFSFKSPTDLTSADPDRLPQASRKSRMVITDKGEVEVTRTDGYRVLYNNDKGAPFVNLKVELSDRKAYAEDKKNLLDNLQYLISHSESMETKDLMVLEFNGFKVYGLSRSTIETGSTLGIFVMFPGKGLTVYFYFNNLKPGVRNFDNLADYKMQRDRFMNEYTGHLKACEQ